MKKILAVWAVLVGLPILALSQTNSYTNSSFGSLEAVTRFQMSQARNIFVVVRPKKGLTYDENKIMSAAIVPYYQIAAGEDLIHAMTRVGTEELRRIVRFGGLDPWQEYVVDYNIGFDQSGFTTFYTDKLTFTPVSYDAGPKIPDDLITRIKLIPTATRGTVYLHGPSVITAKIEMYDHTGKLVTSSSTNYLNQALGSEAEISVIPEEKRISIPTRFLTNYAHRAIVHFQIKMKDGRTLTVTPEELGKLQKDGAL